MLPVMSRPQPHFLGEIEKSDSTLRGKYPNMIIVIDGTQVAAQELEVRLLAMVFAKLKQPSMIYERRFLSKR